MFTPEQKRQLEAEKFVEQPDGRFTFNDDLFEQVVEDGEMYYTWEAVDLADYDPVGAFDLQNFREFDTFDELILFVKGK